MVESSQEWWMAYHSRAAALNYNCLNRLVYVDAFVSDSSETYELCKGEKAVISVKADVDPTLQGKGLLDP